MQAASLKYIPLRSTKMPRSG